MILWRHEFVFNLEGVGLVIDIVHQVTHKQVDEAYKDDRSHESSEGRSSFKVY